MKFIYDINIKCMIKNRQNDNIFGCGVISPFVDEISHYVTHFSQSFGPVTDIDPIIYIFIARPYRIMLIIFDPIFSLSYNIDQ
jgi:hypothetical protein